MGGFLTFCALVVAGTWLGILLRFREIVNDKSTLHGDSYRTILGTGSLSSIRFNGPDEFSTVETDEEEDVPLIVSRPFYREFLDSDKYPQPAWTADDLKRLAAEEKKFAERVRLERPFFDWMNERDE